MHIKGRCCSRLCFHGSHTKVVSDPRGELPGLQDTSSRMGSQALQPTKACHGFKSWSSIDIDFLFLLAHLRECSCVLASGNVRSQVIKEKHTLGKQSQLKVHLRAFFSTAFHHMVFIRGGHLKMDQLTIISATLLLA